MATNKKPRHKHRAKTIVNGAKEAYLIKGVNELITRIGLIVEVKLPRGLCDTHDMSMIRTHLNWISFMLGTRTYIDEAERAEATLVHEKTAKAFSSLMLRKRDDPSRFTATGDELNAIREGIAYFDLPMRDALKKAPKHMERDFRRMQAYMKRVDP